MSADMDSTIDALKTMLDRPDAAQTLESLLGAFLGGEDKSNDVKNNTSPQDNDITSHLGDFPIESVIKIADAYKNMTKQKDPRITLLKAIKPYVRSERSESVDTAIKLLSLLRLAPLLGELKDVL